MWEFCFKSHEGKYFFKCAQCGSCFKSVKWEYNADFRKETNSIKQGRECQCFDHCPI